MLSNEYMLGNYIIELPEGFKEDKELRYSHDEYMQYVFNKENVTICFTLNKTPSGLVGTIDDSIRDVNYRLRILLPEYDLISANKNDKRNIAVLIYKYIKNMQDTTNMHFIIFRENIVIQICCIMPSNEMLKWSDTVFDMINSIE